MNETTRTAGWLAVTPWDRPVDDGNGAIPAGTLEVRDLARGLAGALFVSLPLLFTQEMWDISAEIPLPVLILFLLIAIVVNRIALEFAGYRHCRWQRSKWWDAIVTMGIGMLGAVLTLLVAGIISPSLDLYLALRLVALETVPMSLGAALAVNQLGAGDAAERGSMPFGFDVEVLIGSLLGGFLFAFNIAPTMETQLVVESQSWWLVLATALLSLGISYLMVSVAQVEQRDLSRRKILTSDWLEALVAYVVAFLLSMVLLWVFGYGTPLDPIEVWLPQTVALAYATALGGAAGRLIL
ncbi:DUF2391 family protein [Tsuneonella sp. SYSU-LHT278]|uniref:DUF2391 family protein n=1 Tax=Tsuneonella sediminis TaxID=3416089 RepID=UPI003F7A9411